MEDEADLDGGARVGTLRTLLEYTEGSVEPGTRGRKKLVRLLSMHRHYFLRFRFAEEGPSDLHVVPSRTNRPQKRVKHESTSHNVTYNGNDDVVVERPLPKVAANSTATRKPTE
jgi:hypothetical protein